MTDAANQLKVDLCGPDRDRHRRLARHRPGDCHRRWPPRAANVACVARSVDKLERDGRGDSRRRRHGRRLRLRRGQQRERAEGGRRDRAKNGASCTSWSTTPASPATR